MPLCRQLGVPAVFFLNAAFVDRSTVWHPTNLVCYAANVCGMQLINAAAKSAQGCGFMPMRSLVDVFTYLLPAISPIKRQEFLDALVRLSGLDVRQLAMEARLYITGAQAKELSSCGFEVGNHTYSHVRCRLLSPQKFSHEIDRNKAELESMSGSVVRSFSVPYGASADLTADLSASHLQASGHEVAFLSESVANPLTPDGFRLDRVSLRSATGWGVLFEVELLPRLRAVRNRVRRHAKVSILSGVL